MPGPSRRTLSSLPRLKSPLWFTFVVAAVALAGSARADPDAAFAAMDTNRDGVVDERELASFADAMFTRMDVNHDGVLTALDFHSAATRPGAKPAPMLAAHVPDYLKAAAADGSITYAEFLAASEAHTQAVVQHGRKVSQAQVKVKPAVLAAHLQQAKAEFQRFDTNRDGVLTLADFFPHQSAYALHSLATLVPDWMRPAVNRESIARPAFEQAFLLHARWLAGNQHASFDRTKFRALSGQH